MPIFKENVIYTDAIKTNVINTDKIKTAESKDSNNLLLNLLNWIRSIASRGNMDGSSIASRGGFPLDVDAVKAFNSLYVLQTKGWSIDKCVNFMLNSGYNVTLTLQKCQEPVGTAEFEFIEETASPKNNQLYYCVRVYPDGSAKHTTRDEKGMQTWVDYNKKHRWGNFLFVDGEIVSEYTDSYASFVDNVSKKIKKILPVHKYSVYDKMIVCMEFLAGQSDYRYGYPDEAVLYDDFKSQASRLR